MNILLIWAWWTWISSLWFLLTELWYTNIIWVDSTESQITNALQSAGVKVILGHGQYEVQQWDLVIFSDAAPHAPEVMQARDLVQQEIKWARNPLSYFQFLGEISKQFETISIAGTHGKSTTSAMLTYTMSRSDPSFWLGILGALVPQLNNTNYRLNPSIKSDIATIFDFIITGNYKVRDESLRKKYRFVIEADEFNRHFLYLDTDYAIILNAELDHSDIYPNEQVYMDTFIEFTHKVKKKIFVLEWEKGIDYIIQHWPSTVTSIYKADIDLPYVFGDHVQKNASLNNALLKEIWVTNYNLWDFKGLRRRMELLKKYDNWWLLYSDYWHHPTEIKAVLDAFREKFPTKKLIAIFQPHQARRVLEFWQPFTETMQWFDEAIIYDIYVARENLDELLQLFPTKSDYSISSVDELGNYFAQDSKATYTKDFNTVTSRIENIQPDEVICIFTAGNLDFKTRNYLAQ
jgi:UDP-N-acetylmuramate--alanine ligase